MRVRAEYLERFIIFALLSHFRMADRQRGAEADLGDAHFVEAQGAASAQNGRRVQCADELRVRCPEFDHIVAAAAFGVLNSEGKVVPGYVDRPAVFDNEG